MVLKKSTQVKTDYLTLGSFLAKKDYAHISMTDSEGREFTAMLVAYCNNQGIKLRDKRARGVTIKLFPHHILKERVELWRDERLG